MPSLRSTARVLSAIESRSGIDFGRLEALIAPSATFGTFRLLDKKRAPYAEVLVVRIPGAQSASRTGVEPIDVIHEALWTLFGSLAALELRTDAVKSIALPLLAGTWRTRSATS